MNRQTIEQAADNYAAKATPSYTNGDFDRHAIAEAFECGADWRINSVWHNLPNDLPQKENTWILLELIFEGRLVYLPVEWINDGKGAPHQATRWAYVADLLPDRKEDKQ